ncbi:MAG: hypothetical protein RJA59_736 [Pseudomonadota bacterium]|jgi:hypothetical protein
MLTPDLAAWLGPVADTATPDQMEAIAAATLAITARYTDEDLREDREAALSGAVQVIVGDDTLEGLGADWQAKRAAEMTAHATLTGAIIAARVLHSERELPEVEIERRTGMSRVSVRKALGKR